MRYAIVIWTLLIAMGPGSALACVYPAAVQRVNAVLVTALDTRAPVDVNLRMQVRRALNGTSIVAMQDAMRGDLSRREMRDVRAVLGTANALAEGQRRTLPADLRDQTSRVAAAMHTACSGADGVAAGTTTATDVERGVIRNSDKADTSLQFGEGVMRLTMTFTIYMLFLAFLLGLRTVLNARIDATLPDHLQEMSRKTGTARR